MWAWRNVSLLHCASIKPYLNKNHVWIAAAFFSIFKLFGEEGSTRHKTNDKKGEKRKVSERGENKKGLLNNFVMNDCHEQEEGKEETKPYLCLFSWLPVAITLPPPTPPGIQQVNQTLLIINVVPGRRAQLWGERFESREKIKVIEFFMTSGGAWSMMAMKYAGSCRWGREKSVEKLIIEISYLLMSSQKVSLWWKVFFPAVLINYQVDEMRLLLLQLQALSSCP